MAWLIRHGWLIAACLFALAFPMLATAVGQDFYISVASRVLIWGLLATSLNLLVGTGGMVSMGHAAFFGFGAYVVGIVALDAPQWSAAPVVLPLAIVATGILAFVIGAICLRTRGVYFIMITLAFAQMLYFGAVGLKDFGGDDGLSIAERSTWPGLDLGHPATLYYVALVAVLIALYLSWRAVLSPFGLVFRASKANARRAIALGHPVARYQWVAYVLSAVTCGVAGALLANLTQFASPSYGAWTLSGELIVIVIIGGIGTVFGPVIGAIILLALEEMLPALVDAVMPDYKSNWMLLLGLFIFIVALALKRGVYGSLAEGSRGERP